jgi:acylphosphatase
MNQRSQPKLGLLWIVPLAVALVSAGCSSGDTSGKQQVVKPSLTTAPGTSTKQVTLPAGLRRVHVFVSGRVQGVGFRAFTQQQARLLKLTGWVRNLDDGRVEAVIEGPAKAVDALLVKLKIGPGGARVDATEAKDEPAEGKFDDFLVLR